MISTRKIFNQVNHANLRHLRAISFQTTESVRIRIILLQSPISKYVPHRVGIYIN